MKIDIAYLDDEGKSAKTSYSPTIDGLTEAVVRLGYQETIVDSTLVAAREAKQAEVDAADNTTPEYDVLVSELRVIDNALRTRVTNPASKEKFLADYLDDHILSLLVNETAATDAAEQAKQAERDRLKELAKAKLGKV